MTGGKKPGGAVEFNSGIVTEQAPTIIASNVDQFGFNKPTTLANLAGAGPHATLIWTMRALAMPTNTQTIKAVHDPSIAGGLSFLAEILPAGETIQYWNPGAGNLLTTHYSYPVLHTFLAGTVRGASVFANYYSLMPRFAAGVNQLFQLFVNWQGGSSRIGSVQLFQDTQGQPSTMVNALTTTIYGPFTTNNGIMTNSGLFPGYVNVNWGSTLSAPGIIGWQPDYYVGGNPVTGFSRDTSLNAVMGPLTFETQIPGYPAATRVALINDVGGFRTPPISGAGIVDPVNYPSLVPAVHLSGFSTPPGSGGYYDNQGYFPVDTLTEAPDTSFNTPYGFSALTAPSDNGISIFDGP